ncbi:MAG TPA: hypothetical protein VKL40_11195 [Candidatus Angelobacter sp.]|nr:hypothetical protein [Candidatus Angelobacter sp.]
MQTLNVGAGRTDQEYHAAEEQRRADLLTESKHDANYFFVAAVLAAIGTGIFLMRLNILVSIGAIDLLSFYGRRLGGEFHALVMYGAAFAWVAILVGLGFAAQRGYRWAFLAGLVLYGADMVPLALTISWASLGVHAFFLLKWYQGQKALQDLQEAAAG